RDHPGRLLHEVARHWLYRGFDDLAGLRDCVAPGLALVDWEHIDRNGEYTEGRGVLLGDDHVLANPRHGPGGLGRRYQGHGLPGSGRRFRWVAPRDRSSLLLHKAFPRRFVLGGIRPDSPTRRSRRRLSR